MFHSQLLLSLYFITPWNSWYIKYITTLQKKNVQLFYNSDTVSVEIACSRLMYHRTNKLLI